MNFEKAFLTKRNHIIEIERFGSVFVVWEYNKDTLRENLELKEIKEFIGEFKKQGYKLTIVQ